MTEDPKELADDDRDKTQKFRREIEEEKVRPHIEVDDETKSSIDTSDLKRKRRQIPDRTPHQPQPPEKLPPFYKEGEPLPDKFKILSDLGYTFAILPEQSVSESISLGNLQQIDGSEKQRLPKIKGLDITFQMVNQRNEERGALWQITVSSKVPFAFTSHVRVYPDLNWMTRVPSEVVQFDQKDIDGNIIEAFIIQRDKIMTFSVANEDGQSVFEAVVMCPRVNQIIDNFSIPETNQLEPRWLQSDGIQYFTPNKLVVATKIFPKKPVSRLETLPQVPLKEQKTRFAQLVKNLLDQITTGQNQNGRELVKFLVRIQTLITENVDQEHQETIRIKVHRNVSSAEATRITMRAKELLEKEIWDNDLPIQINFTADPEIDPGLSIEFKQ